MNFNFTTFIYGYLLRFYILNEKGERIHTQNSEYLEDGDKSYDIKKVADFLKAMKRILWLAVLVTAWCVNVPAPAQIAGGAASLRRLVSAAFTRRQVERIGEQFADLAVLRGDGGDIRNLSLVSNRTGVWKQALGDGRNGGVVRVGQIEPVPRDVREVRAVAVLRLDPALGRLRGDADAVVFAEEDERQGVARVCRVAGGVDRAGAADRQRADRHALDLGDIREGLLMHLGQQERPSLGLRELGDGLGERLLDVQLLQPLHGPGPDVGNRLPLRAGLERHQRQVPTSSLVDEPALGDREDPGRQRGGPLWWELGQDDEQARE